jgi:hypothetical protein
MKVWYKYSKPLYKNDVYRKYPQNDDPVKVR